MLTWLTKFLSPIAGYWQAILAVLVTSALWFSFHTIDIDHLKALQVKALADQASQITDYDKAKALITSGGSDEFLKDTNRTNAAFDDSLRVLYTAKADGSISTGVPSRNDGAASDTRLYYTDIKAALALQSRMKIASHQTDQLVECQAYSKKTHDLLEKYLNDTGTK